MRLDLRRLSCAFIIAQCAFCIGLSAQSLTPGIGTTSSSVRDAADKAQYGPLKKIGGSVKTPVIICQVEPEYSEEARLKSFSGKVLVGLVVDKEGMPRDVHVIRGVGMGLDEKSIEAVSQYRFRPAMENGQPVAVRLNVETMFKILNKKEAKAMVAKYLQQRATPKTAGEKNSSCSSESGAPTALAAPPRNSQ